MRSLGFLVTSALLALAAPALAQGPKDDAGAAADPAKQKEIDVAYQGRCEKGTSKELCACVISVADSQIADPGERQVFYDFMMGDVEKAKTARGTFSPEKNMRFNAALQKADVMLGTQCDKLKPKSADAPQDGGQSPQSPDKKL